MTVGKGLTLTGRAQGTYRFQTADSICDSYGNPRLCNLSRDSDLYDTTCGTHDWSGGARESFDSLASTFTYDSFWWHSSVPRKACLTGS
jgi:hypothetical protein